ncbi:MAG TPA: A24 family peptidase [Stellaceae bacterium]|nr:A24 family peptidase [Stellaceae bacterium]
MSTANAVGLLALVVVALAIGSFAGTLVLRLPAGEGMLGRSRCRACDAILTPRELVPLASWLLQRGRCRTCGARLPYFYPAVELLALALGLWAWSAADGWLLWASCGLGWTLMTLALIDLEHQILPDLLTLPLVAAGLAVAWFAVPQVIIDNLAGAAVGFALFAIIAWAYRRWRGREGLGAGDAKLLAALGAWDGASGLPSIILIASLAALAGALAARSFRLKGALQDRVPFGPALALAGWIVWLYGPLSL